MGQRKAITAELVKKKLMWDCQGIVRYGTEYGDKRVIVYINTGLLKGEVVFFCWM